MRVRRAGCDSPDESHIRMVAGVVPNRFAAAPIFSNPTSDMDSTYQIIANHGILIASVKRPNIVVNGDAEMLHALAFKSGQCVVAQSGSLQEAPMREEVCQIMEGGRQAFERRYKRLGRS